MTDGLVYILILLYFICVLMFGYVVWLPRIDLDICRVLNVV